METYQFKIFCRYHNLFLGSVILSETWSNIEQGFKGPEAIHP